MVACRSCLAWFILVGCTPARSEEPPAERGQKRVVEASSSPSASKPSLTAPARSERGDTRGPLGRSKPARDRTGELYDIGELPSELRLRWPKPPVTSRKVEVRSLAEFERAAAHSGTRVIVVGDLRGGPATINGSDVEIAVRPGVRIERLVIGPGQKRVAVRGGRYGEILLTLPAQFSPTKVSKPEWMIEDVIIDGVEVDSPQIGIAIYGRRVAVLRSEIRAQTYSVWSEAIMGIGSEDIVLAGNSFDSAGPEATVRLVSVVRSVTVDNVLENSTKHNYRIHGHSDLNYAARNVLINTGVMIGTMPEDHVGRAWFERNTFYHTAPDLFHPDQTRVDSLEVRDNVAYTNVWTCFYCGAVPKTWRAGGNRVLPYRHAPARERRHAQGERRASDPTQAPALAPAVNPARVPAVAPAVAPAAAPPPAPAPARE